MVKELICDKCKFNRLSWFNHIVKWRSLIPLISNKRHPLLMWHKYITMGIIKAYTINLVRKGYFPEKLLVLVPDPDHTTFVRCDSQPQLLIIIKSCKGSFMLFLFLRLDHVQVLPVPLEGFLIAWLEPEPDTVLDIVVHKVYSTFHHLKIFEIPLDFERM